MPLPEAQNKSWSAKLAAINSAAAVERLRERDAIPPTGAPAQEELAALAPVDAIRREVYSSSSRRNAGWTDARLRVAMGRGEAA